MTQEVLKEAIEFTEKRVLKLHFEKGNKYHSVSLAVYCSLIELSKSFCRLSENALRAGALTLYRSFLEYFVDLKNLSLDQKYIYILELDHAKTKQRQFKSAQKDNPYCSSLKPLSSQQLPKLKTEISGLKKKLKINRVMIKDKFKKAKMLYEYEGLYSFLCSESHCNLSGLIDRHYRLSEDGTQVEVMAYNYEKKESDIFYFTNMANYLILSGELICTITQNEMVSEFQEYRDSIIQRAKKNRGQTTFV